MAIVLTAIGLVVLVPQMLKPRGWAREYWTGSDVSAFGVAGVMGMAVTWLRTQFGPTASGLFTLALGTGMSVATSVASTHSSTWRLSGWAFIGSCLAALAVATVAGAVVRHFGRFVDRDGHYVPRRSALRTAR